MRNSSRSVEGPVEEVKAQRLRKAKLERVSRYITKDKKAGAVLTGVGVGVEQAGRKTGIDILGDVAWGVHFCVFYQSKQDLIDILVPYFKAGLENNEFCMWITSKPLSAEDAEKSLSQAVTNLDDYIKKGQIEILDYSQCYIKSGKFQADQALEGWVKKHEQAIKRGFDGLRFTKNASWLEKKNCVKFANYEAVVNSVIGKYRMLAICTYSLDKYGASETMDVVGKHEFALIRREGKWELVESSKRKKAKEALRQSEERYKYLFEQFPLGIVLASPDGKVARANKTMEVITGYFEAELKRINLADTFENPKDWKKLLKTIERYGCAVDFPARLKRKDGTSYDALLNVSRVHLGGQDLFQTIYVDITERKKVEEQIVKLAKFPAENPNPVLRISARGTVVYGNEASLPLLKAWQCRVGGSVSGRWYEFVLDALSSGQSQQTEVQCDGQTFSLVFAPVMDANYVNVYGLDITERKRAKGKLIEYQEQLKSLASQLTLTEEQERRRIATELHDNITQSLAMSKLKLDLVRDSKSSSSADLVEVLNETSKNIEHIIQEVRTLTFDLSSPILYELGFEAAVAEWLTERIEKEHYIATEFEDDGQPKPLDDDTRTVLFRDVRELLTNVVKHAQAKKVKVSIRKDHSRMHVIVEDDGRGFDPKEVAATAAKAGEFGLFSIRERLKQLGGNIEIESAAGHGTRVTLVAPLKSKS